MANIDDWVKAYQREGMKYKNGLKSGGINDVDVTSLGGDQLDLYNKDRQIYDSYVRAAQQLKENQTKLAIEGDNRKQQAYIDSELAKKYLPQQQKANGTYGLDAGEAAQRSLLNSYRNAVNAIHSDLSDRGTQLSNSFDDYAAALNGESLNNQADYQRLMDSYKRQAQVTQFAKDIGSADTDIDEILSQLEQNREFLGDYYIDLHQNAWDRKWDENKNGATDYLNSLSQKINDRLLKDGRMPWEDYREIMDYANSIKGNLRTSDFDEIFGDISHETEEERNAGLNKLKSLGSKVSTDLFMNHATDEDGNKYVSDETSIGNVAARRLGLSPWKSRTKTLYKANDGNYYMLNNSGGWSRFKKV